MKNILLISLLSVGLFANSGEELYKKCAGCHGDNGEKSALGKSLVISNMLKEDIENSLLGYKNPTYGGTMRNIMNAQVKYLSEENIKTLSSYIKTFK